VVALTSEEGNPMSLMTYRVSASVAVADMERARHFYEEKLGLAKGVGQADGARIYACGGGTSLHVYPSPPSARKTVGTVATWYVADLERVVDELSAVGVIFEQYDDPELRSDGKGIHVPDDGRVAWFRDPTATPSPSRSSFQEAQSAAKPTPVASRSGLSSGRRGVAAVGPS
jgi:catechol 2,3-dioxygenase-like lactoylglutathione lyase family enzyme